LEKQKKKRITEEGRTREETRAGVGEGPGSSDKLLPSKS
jgi:hypothetical protein